MNRSSHGAVRAIILGLSMALVAGTSTRAQRTAAETAVRKWSFYQVVSDAVGEERIGEPRRKIGGSVFERYEFGPLLVYPPQFDPSFVPNAAAEVSANKSGRNFWVSTEAPYGVTSPGNPFGSSAELSQHQWFVKQDAKARLQLVVTRAFSEVIDYNPDLPREEECSWRKPGGDVGRCLDVTWAESSFTVFAYDVNDRKAVFSTGGYAALRGWHGVWDLEVETNHDATVPFWDKEKFFFDPNVGGGVRSHAQMSLDEPMVIDVPLSNLRVGSTFAVAAFVKSRAFNRRQRESYVAAYFRDPEETEGLSFRLFGVRAVPTPDEPPDAPPPVPAPPCATGVDPAAGVIEFASTSFSTPEIAGGDARIVVTRSGGSRGAVSAMFATTDNSATAGVDYTAVTTPVLFADGESGSRVVRVPILLDGDGEPDETVDLMLSDPGGCAALGQNTSAQLTILDDDETSAPPTTYSVGGTVTGLAGSGLVLREVIAGDEVSPTADGPFTFGYALPAGSSYDVRIASQPINPIQVCTVANGTGTIVDVNVTDVEVTCVTPLPGGGVDGAFGSAGKVTTGLPGGATAMALQTDGKIVLVGGRTLARYNSDGTPDAGFGMSGSVAITFNGGIADAALAVALQPDGRILVAGFTRVGTQDDFALARYNSNGTLDGTFGTGGAVSTDFNGAVDKAWAVLVLDDGRIVLAGHAATNTPLGVTNDFALARYMPTGQLDPSFGVGGKTTTDIAGSVDLAYAAALQADGRIVVAGRVAATSSANADVGVARYNTDGALDATFGTAGIVKLDLSNGEWDEASDIAVLDDSSLVISVQGVVGTTFKFLVARLNPGGGLDTSFGVGGVATTSFGTLHDYARALAVQPDGKIIVVGQTSDLANTNMAIVRHNPDGTPDASFGTDGKVTVDFFGSTDGAECVRLQPDGRIVVAGVARNGSANGLGMVRLLP